MTARDEYEWRYLAGRKTKHLLRRFLNTLDIVAMCGAQPLGQQDWHGSGSQDEYERVKTHIPCQRCIRAVLRRDGQQSADELMPGEPAQPAAQYDYDTEGLGGT